jgi:thioester reductase-like protein
MDRGPVLLTGATGFVGVELLARYLERTERHVVCLVRAADDAAADLRLRAALAPVLEDAEAYAHRFTAVPADLEAPGLGLPVARREALAEAITEVVHSAASVSFTLGLEESRAINVGGTRRMLELAELAAARGGLRRFAYVSTAYVAGTHRGTFGEDDLDTGQGFHNAYEQTKHEAETLVRAHRERLPIQVFRPSIVVGEEDTGWTPAFNVIYWPLRAFSKGAYAALPLRRRSPVDVVPVSYVADAILALTTVGEAGETYTLAAGPEAATVGEMMALGAAAFDRRPPRAIPPRLYRRLIHPLLLRRAGTARRSVLERSEVFFPYFAMPVRFGTERACARLAPLGIAPPPLASYFERLVAYAVQARWGKVAVPRFAVGSPDGTAPVRPGGRFHRHTLGGQPARGVRAGSGDPAGAHAGARS